MDKKDFMDWFRGILITMLIIFLMVGIIWGLEHIIDTASQKRCKMLGDQIGYNTKRVSGVCFFEIRPNIWIAKHNIVNILPLIDCERDE